MKKDQKVEILAIYDERAKAEVHHKESNVAGAQGVIVSVIRDKSSVYPLRVRMNYPRGGIWVFKLDEVKVIGG